MRKAVWIAAIIAVVAACGFGYQGPRRGSRRHRPGRSHRPQLHPALAGRQARQPLRLQGQVGRPLLLPQGPDHRAAPSKPTTSSATWPSTTPSTPSSSASRLDTVESHKTWCTKDTFSFKLLADPDHKVVDAYGVPVMARGDMKFATRDTFLISPSRQDRQGLGEGRSQHPQRRRPRRNRRPTRSRLTYQQTQKGPGSQLRSPGLFACLSSG